MPIFRRKNCLWMKLHYLRLKSMYLFFVLFLYVYHMKIRNCLKKYYGISIRVVYLNVIYIGVHIRNPFCLTKGH